MQFDEEDISFFSTIKKEIDALTDKEVIALSKISQKIDVEAVHKKNATLFFNSVTAMLEKCATQCNPFFEQLKKDDSNLYEKLKNSAKDDTEETLIKKMSDYKTMKDLKKKYEHLLTTEELKKLQTIGENWLNTRQFDKAHLYFIFLSIFLPSNVDIWIFKGISEQNMMNYDEALQSYLTALTLDSTRLLPYLQMIDCLILNKKTEEAKQLYSALETEVHPNEYAAYPSYIKKLESIKQFLANAT